jgi:hypothetical protein
MADTHEEQLLSDLLRSIAREDAAVEAPHLELRVLTAAEAGVRARQKPSAAYWVIAAALLAAVLVPLMSRTTPQAPTQSSQETAKATEQPFEEERPAPVVPKQAAPVRTELRTTYRPRAATPTIAELPTADLRIAQSPIAQSPMIQSPIAQSPDEFFPLMPITAQELAGSFQLVRVQMPRASLGPLRSPLEQPNELVEADVLLGEDGMARAIRVSASGSVYPWRSR